MKNYLITWGIIGFIILNGCSNPEDVSPANKDTFVKYFGESLSNQGTALTQLSDGGFIFTFTSTYSDKVSSTIVKTDHLGNTQWRRKFDGIELRAMALKSDAFYFVGDSVENITLTGRDTKLFIMHTNTSGDVLNYSVFGDSDGEEPFLNWSATDATLYKESAGSPEKLVVLGEREKANGLIETILLQLDIESATLTADWIRSYELLTRSYTNGQHIFKTKYGKLIFGASAVTATAENIDSYISIATVNPESQAISHDLYGQNSVNIYYMESITQSFFGFGVLGTIKNPNNTGGNLIFMKITENGLIEEGSEVIFGKDGDDTGNSIASSIDGGYITLGSISTTLNVGNGGTDFYLVKLNGTGQIEWESIIGGSGNERGSTIIQTTDGGYAFLGTTTLQGTAMVTLVKTNGIGRLN
jgi:hypothetical protein